ncbi:MAG: T9SS type A sorting domain-containing protein [candidate division KSB1 bacterium]|nr:T9SS type A sorting domain-containing protein [candidate division KSB1 bacterium]MDZ7394092.1 T9SS type A sorting domain-containing protein [candidate division KSB1 bacterium]MDZ7414406.1 T9SS type A sorting domain-containing protein [candidate division KSB1 bacterium]
MRRAAVWCIQGLLSATVVMAQGVAVGLRVDLTDSLGLNRAEGQFAQLFVPDYFQPPQDGRLTLVVHLHSASWAAENQVYKAHANAALVNIHLGALSSPYKSYFSDQSRFAAMLEVALRELATRGIVDCPQLGTLIVTSFSAGYAGVREIIKNGSYYEQLRALELADGLHCSSDPGLMIAQMADFVRFARDAAAGRKVMLLTHSSIKTAGYESTTQTADYLIAAIGAARVPCALADEIGFQYSRCDTGHFHLRGYLGDTADDHLKHLYAMDTMLAQALEILGSQPSGSPQGRRSESTSLSVRVYPNPCNPRATFRCQIPTAGQLRLTVYDVLGQEIFAFEGGHVPAGLIELAWNPSALPAGVYAYRLQAGGATAAGHCIVLR